MRVAVFLVLASACQYEAPASPDDGPIDPDPDGPIDTPSDTPIDTPPLPFWVNVVGATPTDNSLMDIAATGWNKSGASTREQIASGNGYVEFTTAEQNLGKAFGLSNGDVSRDFSDIDFAIHLRATREVFVFQNSTSLGAFGTYVIGDVFRVEVTNNVVTYKKNGAQFFVSPGTPVFPLLGDAALFHTNSTITNVSVVQL
ncbi:MAG: hypothetical protein H0V17_15705 [Deltaproteobacteria bacterium]|nr:hypothetical protein [Deltaproteobacteria bacterium]